MRVHLVGLPHTQVTRAFPACAFTEKVRRFAIMMKGLGHEVVLYAGEETDAPVDELVPCFSERDRQAAVAGRHYTEASFDPALPYWRRFNLRAAIAIRKRAGPRDFVCVIGGVAHKPIAAALPDLVTVEFGIGYAGTFARYRVFESHAWRHVCYGAAAREPAAADGFWFDDVIPGYFEPEAFPFSAEKDDYLLFVGRLIDRKGAHIAAEIAAATGRRLVVAGHGKAPPGAEHVGVVGPEERGRLMSRARALIAPTLYLEPFGNIVPEAHFCGTPTLTTDWGAFTETNENGVTGWRCRSLGEFVDAVDRVGDLDAAAIRARAVARYSLAAVAPLYQAYFKRLSTLWGRGWYAGVPPRPARAA
ncbi:MAG: glycosyltransferase [Rhodospirillaceae bacterium]